MMKQIANLEFENIRINGISTTIENIAFEQCSFFNCYFSKTSNPSERVLAKDIIIKNCKQKNCVIDAGIIENVLIENLNNQSLLQFWGTAFKNFVLKGKVGRIMISPLLLTATAPVEVQASFDVANEKFYSGVDLVLDIKDALFYECDIRGINTDLIRRDPISQVIINKDVLKTFNLDKVDFKGTFFNASIKLFMDREDQNLLLVAPKMDKNYTIYQNVLDNLVAIGLAER